MVFGRGGEAAVDPVADGGAYIDYDTAKIFLTVITVMMTVHVPLALFAPITVFSHPMGYFGKHGLGEQLIGDSEGDSTSTVHGARFVIRFYGIWFFNLAALFFSVLSVGEEAATPNFWLSLGVLFGAFAIYMIYSIFGWEGGNYLSTRPTFVNQCNLAGWIVGNTVFSAVFFLAVDWNGIATKTADYSNGSLAMTLVLLLAVSTSLHVIPMTTHGLTFVTQKLTYMGKAGSKNNHIANWHWRGFGLWLLGFGALYASVYHNGGAPSNVWIGLAAGQLSFAIFIFANVFGLEGGDYLKSKPGTINKANMMSWVVLQTISAIVFFKEAQE